jgi:pilus assembly protein CpaC
VSLPQFRPVPARFLAIAALSLLLVGVASAVEPASRVRIPVSRSQVVTFAEELRTVAIADPRIADAAVGSGHTVIVTAKSPGITSLVLYAQNGGYVIHEIEVFVPHANDQVMLHVRVAEVTEEAKRKLGVDWFAHGNHSHMGTLEGGLFTGKISDPAIPLPVGSGTDGILSYTSPHGGLFLQAAWRALEEQGQIRTLANPSLLARSGEKAEFLAGGEIPVPVASSSGIAGSASVTVQWKPFGVGVSFTPRVLDSGMIQLSVTPEVSQLDYSNSVTLAGYTVPSLISRRASTTVELASGEHLVIGGLRQTDRTKHVSRVPLLGHIPILGLLFSSSSIDSVQRELVLVVSPEWVEHADTALPRLPTDAAPSDSTSTREDRR